MAEESNLVALTIEVVANYVAHNNLAPESVPDFIAKTHAAIAALSKTEQPAAEPAAETGSEHVPAVTVRKSLGSRDHILSMIDGRPYKTLKRHLSGHGLTPAKYRERYGLKPDYPMVAPAYSEHRREVAKALGLGRKPKAPPVEPAAAPLPEQAAPDAPRKRRGKAKSAPPGAEASPKPRRGGPPRSAAAAPAQAGDAS